MISQVYDAIRLRATTGALPFPTRWQNEDGDSAGNLQVPDPPAVFAYLEFLTGTGSFVAFGAGRGNNTQRTPGVVNAYVFAPRGTGLKTATDAAELIAALYRGHRETLFSCFAATVHPGGDGAAAKPLGLDSAVDGYFWAQVEVELFFDQLG